MRKIHLWISLVVGVLVAAIAVKGGVEILRDARKSKLTEEGEVA